MMISLSPPLIQILWHQMLGDCSSKDPTAASHVNAKGALAYRYFRYHMAYSDSQYKH